jgi:hypothetical protein
MTDLVLPQISLNGTSKEQLLEQQLEVLHAFRRLEEAMACANPNGRDYQHRPEEYKAAREAWDERRTVVRELHKELSQHAMNISDLTGGRL